MAYTRLSISEKEIERLFPVILNYKEIRFLDISTNTITDISILDGFNHLIWLNASKNQIPNLEVFTS